MEITTVKAEDVYEDECNPRSDFGDLKALAESFGLNKLRPGQPVNPPVLVRDGGIYRIVDGARRYRAMKLMGTKEFDAIVCEDYDDADTILAMLATDDKKQLTPVEQSKGVQRALLLGVEPVKVEKATKSKGAARVRRAMEVTGSEAEGMTIGHLLAIEEFAEDQARRDRLINATESTWQDVLKACQRERRNEKAIEAMTERCYDLGYEIADERPDGFCYVGTFRRSEDVTEPQRDGLVAVPYNSWEASMTIYGPTAEEEQADPETIRRQQRADEFEALLEETSKRREEWLLSEVESTSWAKHTKRLATVRMFALDKAHDEESTAYRDGFQRCADEWCKASGTEKGEHLAGQCSGILAVYVLTHSIWPSPHRLSYAMGPCEPTADRLESVRRAIRDERELAASMRMDGYEADESEARITEIMFEAAEEMAAVLEEDN